MPDIKRIGDLEISEDLPHQRREWAIERWGWAIMGAILLAALAGLLGSGPLSSTIGGEPGTTLWVEYQRFIRNQAPARLRIHLTPPSGDSKARISINREFIENIELRHIDPQPETVETHTDRLTYVFNVPDAGKPAAVTYHFSPSKFGILPARIDVDGGGIGINFRQFVYP